MNNPKKVFYVMMSVLVFVLALGLGAFYFTDSKLSEKAGRISELKAEDEVLEEQVRRGQELKSQLESLQFTEQIISEVLPSSKEQSNFVGELIAMEKEAGVTLDGIGFLGSDIASGGDPDFSQTEDLTEIGNVKILPVTTSFKCATFNELSKFLVATETNQRKMQVSRIDIVRVCSWSGG